MHEDQCYVRLAAARVLGWQMRTGRAPRTATIDSVTPEEIEDAFDTARAEELRIHSFKRKTLLPRVTKALGYLLGVPAPHPPRHRQWLGHVSLAAPRSIPARAD